MNKIMQAARYAEEAHRGQLRKYTGNRYITHPARVATRVILRPDSTEDMVCAAWLHDVIEDTGRSAQGIEDRFGGEVESLVVQLTNTPKVAGQSREEKKANDRERLRGVSTPAKVIKLLDRIDNIREMSCAPDSFKDVYAQESKALLTVLAGTDADLEEELEAAIRGLVIRKIESPKGMASEAQSTSPILTTPGVEAISEMHRRNG